MMTAVKECLGEVSVKPLCASLGLSRETYYRRLRPPRQRTARLRPVPVRALSTAEQGKVLETLHSDRFVDRAPEQVYASLLDAGIYLCSPRTMYRVLAAHREVRERRDQARHPRYAKPMLEATAPNQVWSWDITKLLGPEKWSYFYLYVLLDVFSRYVVGWMLAQSESAELARRLVRESCDRHAIDAGTLTLHSDRGAPMTSKTLGQMLADLGVERSLSRPRTSNDNPFIESHFKTLKYSPGFPDRFRAGYAEALANCRRFFPWYNDEHHHSGLAGLTPADVHFGRVDHALALHEDALRTAFAAHPERFVRGLPRVASPPAAVWINPPASSFELGAAVALETPSDRSRAATAVTSRRLTPYSLNSSAQVSQTC
jgi:putative transposase